LVRHRVLSLFLTAFVLSVCTDADIDECATDNGGCNDQATCTNTAGSFTCECLPGYDGDGITCQSKSL